MLRRHAALAWAAVAVLTGCVESRSHADLMAAAAVDLDAIELERAMARFDSARTVAPEDPDAHRQYARLATYFNLGAEAVQAWKRAIEFDSADASAWDGYIEALPIAADVETDRRYAEELLRILPEALRNTSERPIIYENARFAAEDLGELEAYGAILASHLGARPDDQVLLHHLGAARIALAGATDSERRASLSDSLQAALDELTVRSDGDSAETAAILYRLAAGYDMPATGSGGGSVAGSPGGGS